jgi:hypothetical protein
MESKSPAVSSALAAAPAACPVVHETSAVDMAFRISGYAGLDSTVSLLAGGLSAPHALTEGALLQLQLSALHRQQQERRQQQWHGHVFRSMLEQERIRQGLTRGSAAWSTQRLSELANSDRIGRHALAVAVIKAAMNDNQRKLCDHP